MEGRDYYQVLGVSRRASVTELRQAFVRLAKCHHPDMSSPSTKLPQRLSEIQQAYRCLSDTEGRALHDRVLDERERLHFQSQRALHRRLRRYDRYHPRRPPGRSRRPTWRTLLTLACGAAVVAQLSLRLLG